MSETPLSVWQARFFSERVCTRASGTDGVYFREQVFGALGVLSEALPDVQASLGEQNFRFFVREFLSSRQPQDALGTTLIAPFLEFLLAEDAMPAVASPKPR
ncbi:MAG: hypothetical protein JRH14_13075 [Deltaproteobacteria bacterium]|nr:hypothetical protein [Deltaproteobacteria bacterium]